MVQEQSNFNKNINEYNQLFVHSLEFRWTLSPTCTTPSRLTHMLLFQTKTSGTLMFQRNTVLDHHVYIHALICLIFHTLHLVIDVLCKVTFDIRSLIYESLSIGKSMNTHARFVF